MGHSRALVLDVCIILQTGYDHLHKHKLSDRVWQAAKKNLRRLLQIAPIKLFLHPSSRLKVTLTFYLAKAEYYHSLWFVFPQ